VHQGRAEVPLAPFSIERFQRSPAAAPALHDLPSTTP